MRCTIESGSPLPPVAGPRPVEALEYGVRRRRNSRAIVHHAQQDVLSRAAISDPRGRPEVHCGWSLSGLRINR